MRKRFLLAAAVVFTAVATQAALAAKQPAPAPMTGEYLSALNVLGDDVETHAECEPDGSGVFTFSVSGVATGPYPGTFSETGTIVIAAPTVPFGLGTIDSLEATFTIDSARATITGTKTLRTGTFVAFCQDLPGGDQASGTFPARYTARIEAPTGTFRDEGITSGEFTGGDDAAVQGIGEFFASSLAELVEVKKGQGCGDTNHEHEREGECKKPPR